MMEGSVCRRILWTSAKPMGGDQRSHRLEAHAELILGAVGAKPDITVSELQALLAGHGVKASYGAVWNLLNRHGLTFKKRRCLSSVLIGVQMYENI